MERKNMSQVYEVAVIFHPDFEIDIDKPLSKLQALLNKQGKIEATDDWGKRKLAYPIQGQQFGIYYFFRVTLEPNKISEVERLLTINDEIIRHLVVKYVEPPVEDEKKPDADEEVSVKESKVTKKDKKSAKVEAKG
jgi:small subunit ribosomal protein S6